MTAATLLAVALLAAVVAGLALAACLYDALRDARKDRDAATADLVNTERAYWNLYRQAWTVPAPADTQPVDWIAVEPYGPEKDTDPLTAPTIAVDDLEHTGPIGRSLGDIPALHYETGGWVGGPGECGIECACGTTFDGFDSIGEAHTHLNAHILTDSGSAPSLAAMAESR